MTATAILNQSKLCTKCGDEKSIDHFPVRHGVAYGCVCRECICTRQNMNRAKRLGTEEKIQLSLSQKALFSTGERQCKTCNQVKALGLLRKKGLHFSHECLDCSNEATRASYAANINGKRDRLQKVGRDRRLIHADTLNQQKRVYVAANRAKVTSRQNEWLKAKRKSDPVFALKQRIRSLIGNAFLSVGSRKNMETQKILGCTFAEFMSHLEKQFTAGMSWDRMGVEIHMDHIIPLDTAKNKEDVIALNHFTNLRPMWAAENIRKGAKLLALI